MKVHSFWLGLVAPVTTAPALCTFVHHKHGLAQPAPVRLQNPAPPSLLASEQRTAPFRTALNPKPSTPLPHNLTTDHQGQLHPGACHPEQGAARPHRPHAHPELGEAAVHQRHPGHARHEGAHQQVPVGHAACGCMGHGAWCCVACAACGMRSGMLGSCPPMLHVGRCAVCHAVLHGLHGAWVKMRSMMCTAALRAQGVKCSMRSWMCSVRTL